MKTTKLLMVAFAATCNFVLMAQELSKTVRLENGEEIDVYYEYDNPNDFKDITIEVMPLDVGEALEGAKASYTLRASAKVSEQLSGSLEWRSLYKQVKSEPSTLSNGNNSLYWEAIALGNYTVFSFESGGKYKVKLMKHGRFYSHVKLPHTAKNEFRAQVGVSYLNRTGGTDYNTTTGIRQTATQLGFASVLAGVSYKRSVNAKFSGVKIGEDRFVTSNMFLSKRTWSVYGRVGYTVYTDGEYWATTGVDQNFESITGEEFNPEINSVTFRIGANLRQYLVENLSITFMIEAGAYPGLKMDEDLQLFYPCARVGLGYDL